MTRTKTATGLLVLALASLPLSAWAADITGSWTASYDTPMGKQDYTYTFTQTGSTLTGSSKNDMMGDNPLKDGKIDKDTVTFSESAMIMGMAIVITYSGKIVSADEIDFTRQIGEFGSDMSVAKRVKS